MNAADGRRIRDVPVDAPEARRLLREYIANVAGRHYGRPATAAEIDAELAADPSDDLAWYEKRLG